jgi:hypothetical protein
MTNDANVGFVQLYTATVTVSGSGISSVSFELSCKRILNPVTHPNAFIDYLNTLLPNDAATPILIAFDRGNLGETNLGSAGWSVVHDKVIIAGKYLILDLTNCTVGTASTITGIGGSPIVIPSSDDPNANSFNLIWNNQYIKGIILPSVLTSIGDNACNGCEHLTSVTIPAGVTSIGDNAFNGCSGLTSMVIPANVATIGENAFDGCSGLTSVTFAGNSCAIGDNAFPGASDNGGDGLKTAYNAANPKAGTYTRTAGADDWARQP